MQFVDVRDLAGWLVTAIEGRLSGTYNVTGETITFGSLLAACERAVGTGSAVLDWIGGDRLLAAGVDPWMGVPLWIGAPGWEAANRVDVSRARSAGLELRPLEETVRDTLAWDRDRGPLPVEEQGLPADRERQILEAVGRSADRPAPDADTGGSRSTA